MTPTEQLEEFWQLAADLAIRTGAAPLTKHRGAWFIRLSLEWELAINGHTHIVSCSQFHHHKGAPITLPPLGCYAEFNGWPALVGDPRAAAIAAGSVANAESLLAALRARIAKIPGRPVR